MQALNRLEELNRMTLTWVPGHQDILGNEITNEGIGETGDSKKLGFAGCRHPVCLKKKSHQKLSGAEPRTAAGPDS